MKRSFLILVFFIILNLILHITLRSEPVDPPAIIAHRGASGLAPENTLVAVQEAINLGAYYIEVDVQRSSDRILLLMHDKTINRTTNGQGKVSELSWESLGKLDAGNYFSSEFIGTTIPSLESVLNLIKDNDVNLVIEIKNPHLYPGIEQEIAEIINNHAMSEKVILVSFDYESLQITYRSIPDTLPGFINIYPFSVPHINDNQLILVFWLSILLDPTLIPRMHAKDYKVWAWTANSPQLMKLLVWLGVDGIATDRLDVWNKILLQQD